MNQTQTRVSGNENPNSIPPILQCDKVYCTNCDNELEVTLNHITRLYEYVCINCNVKIIVVSP